MFSQSIHSTFSFLQYPMQGIAGTDRQQPATTPKAPVQATVQNRNLAPQKIIGSTVLDTLEKRLKTKGIDFQRLTAEDFTPAKVADKILSSIQAAFGRFRQTQPAGDTDKFFAEIRKGLVKGFSEAKDILQKSGVLQGQIAEDVDKTYDLTLQRLDKFASLKSPDANDKTVLDTPVTFQSLTAQQSHTTEIQVKTREGDIVTINLTQSSSNRLAALQLQQGDATLQAFRKSHEETRGFSISIEGDLNPDEQKALQKLLKKMHKISNDFFQGNQKKALQHALKLGFDDKQLASFSINLSRRKSFQAIIAYQQTAQPEQKIQAGLLAQAGEFMSHAQAMLNDAKSTLRPLAEPQQSFKELFSSIGLLNSQNTPETDAQTAFSVIVNQLSQSVFAGETRQAA